MTDTSASQGIPLMLFSAAGRALMMSPAEHFFVALHSTMRDARIEAGVKASVRFIPAGFTYDTVIYVGPSVNVTLVGWGDHLLGRTGKHRVDPYADFVLSHLGHWTDAGAYHYQNPAPYPDYEQALLAVKEDAEDRKIPYRYAQFVRQRRPDLSSARSLCRVAASLSKLIPARWCTLLHASQCRVLTSAVIPYNGMPGY